MTAADELIQRELTLNRFRRLLGEITRGQSTRNVFQPWEIALLVDMESCTLPSRRRYDILRQYERAVERQIEAGADTPMKLSQYLVLREQKRTGT